MTIVPLSAFLRRRGVWLYKMDNKFCVPPKRLKELKRIGTERINT